MPLVRIEASQHAARGVHNGDLAAWIDSRREDDVKSVCCTLFDGQSRLDDHEWALIADAYCLRFKVAVLARIAIKARNAKSSLEGIDRAAAERDAKMAMNAYLDAVHKLNLIGEMCDVEIEALRGELWIEKINATVSAYFRRYEIDFNAPPVSATKKWIAELGKTAKAFVDVYDNPILRQTGKGHVPGDIDRLLQEGSENIEAVLIQQGYDDAKQRPAISLKDLVDYMRSVAMAPLAQEDIQDYDLFAKCSSQQRWINNLTEVCEGYGLPTGRSNRLADESEFVGLVKALMERMPKRLVGELTAGALSQAVYRARKKPEEEARKWERAATAAREGGEV